MKNVLQVSTSERHGVTLIEVLMSLMIMSIGVSAVMVLFPISVLRSVQATQLTNAAILKYAAEAIVQMQPQLVFDPDGDGNLDEHIVNKVESRYIVDPSGYFALTSSGATYSTDPTLSIPNNAGMRGLADWVGNLDTNGDGAPEAFLALPRYDGGIRSSTRSGTYPNGFRPAGGNPEEARALALLGSTLSKLGDGWSSQLDTLPVEFVFADGSTGTTAAAGSMIVGLRLDADADLSNISTVKNIVPVVGTTQLIPDPEICRIVVFTPDESFSVALPLLDVNDGSKIALWSEDVLGIDLNMNGILDPRYLPAEFVNSLTGNYEVGKVVLQIAKTQDYNWLLTVRRGSDGQARGVDVVITYNKGITPDDERLFSASFVAGSFVLPILKTSGLKSDGEPSEPLLKKSGYVLDVENARWYRVANYQESPDPFGTGAGPGYLLALETPVIQSSVAGAAMFLPGVVDVYPMGSVPIPQ